MNLQKDTSFSPSCLLLLMPRAVHRSPRTRHMKVRSRASQTEVPLSLILPWRLNGVICWFWFTLTLTANTHSACLVLLQFPRLLCRDSGYTNSIWEHKFREALWKTSSETKRRERQRLLVLFCFAPGSQETTILTAGMTGHGVGASYEAESLSTLYTGLQWTARSVPSFGLSLPRWLKGKAPCCERSWSNSFVFSAGYHCQAEVSRWVT